MPRIRRMSRSAFLGDEIAPALTHSPIPPTPCLPLFWPIPSQNSDSLAIGNHYAGK